MSLGNTTTCLNFLSCILFSEILKSHSSMLFKVSNETFALSVWKETDVWKVLNVKEREKKEMWKHERETNSCIETTCIYRVLCVYITLSILTV